MYVPNQIPTQSYPHIHHLKTPNLSSCKAYRAMQALLGALLRYKKFLPIVNGGQKLLFRLSFGAIFSIEEYVKKCLKMSIIVDG